MTFCKMVAVTALDNVTFVQVYRPVTHVPMQNAVVMLGKHNEAN